MLSALAAAHRAGLIHRDVKPENVLIADDGRVKVADFGLAKAVSADTQHTATGGVLIGTVSYLAPELVVDGRADARADVYAAGVVLYELLTGAQAARGRVARSRSPTSTSTRTSRRRRAPAPGIPAYVDALVARATARDREPAAGRRRRCCCTRCTGSARRSRPAYATTPELTADLRRALPVVVEPEPVEDTAADPFGDTGAEAVAVGELAALMAARCADGPTPTSRAHDRARPHADAASGCRPPAGPAAARARRARAPAGARPAAAVQAGPADPRCSPCCSSPAPASARGGSAGRATPPRPACSA